MAYTPPAGNVAHFQFQEPVAYTPPAGNVAHWERVRYVLATGFDAALFGVPVVTFSAGGAAQTIICVGTDFGFVFNDYGPVDADGRSAGVRHVNVPYVVDGVDFSEFGLPSVST